MTVTEISNCLLVEINFYYV